MQSDAGEEPCASDHLGDDGVMGGVAAADELLIFRKPGNAAPVIHPQRTIT